MPVEKMFFWNAIPNIVLILLLLYYLSRRKGVDGVLVAMFVYLSLHGGYAIFAAATRDGINTLNQLHYLESDLGVRIVAAAFLLLCSILLVVRQARSEHAFLRINRYLLLNIGASLLLFLIAMMHGAQNISGVDASAFFSDPNSLFKPSMASKEFSSDTARVVFADANALFKPSTAFKEFLYAACMWIGIFFFAVLVKPREESWIAFRKEGVIFLAVVCVVTAGCGFYELGTGMVWSGTKYEWGFSYRASGAMFNPNVLGFWCALMIALVALMFHMKWISRLGTLCFMMLLVSTLVLSSSRSGFALSIVNLFTISVLLFAGRKSNHLSAINRSWPLVCFLAIFSLWFLFVLVFHPSEYPLVNTLAANMWRFLLLPMDIFWMFMLKIYLPIITELNVLLTKIDFPVFSPEATQKWQSIQAAGNAHVSGQLGNSVDGRTSIEIASDNVFVSIYAIGGLVAISCWVWLWAVLLRLAIVKNRLAPGLHSSYALVLLVFCFTSGIFLRTPQLFPLWMFISMVLGVCMCWWLSTDDGNSGQDQLLADVKDG
ncbi:MAG: hypothetical protein WCR74_01150 [Betaproteobacteria bacterium]